MPKAAFRLAAFAEVDVLSAARLQDGCDTDRDDGGYAAPHRLRASSNWSVTETKRRRQRWLIQYRSTTDFFKM